jgi:hypothetical protein
VNVLSWIAQQSESGVVARPGPSTHQNFVFFVLFVVRIFTALLQDYYSITKNIKITRDYLCTFFMDGAAA